MAPAATPTMRLGARVDLVVILGVVAALLILGSLADLPISQSLHNQDSGWAILLAAIGEWPAGFGLIIAGVFLIQGRNATRTAIRVIQVGGGAILAALGTFFVAFMPARYLSLPMPVLVGVGVLLGAGVFIGTWVLIRGRDPRALIRIGVGLIVLIIGQMILINLIKIGWSRPRMRMLATHPEYAFNPWWVVGSADQADALAQGIEAEEFKSFPSGHTANAALAIYLAPLLAWFSTTTARFARPALYAGVVWAMAAAVSRIVMGAHLLTGVTIGFVVTAAAIMLTHTIASRNLAPTMLEAPR